MIPAGEIWIYVGGGAAWVIHTNIDRMAKEGAVFYQLVRTGKLYSWPLFVYDGPDSHSLSTFCSSCTRG